MAEPINLTTLRLVRESGFHSKLETEKDLPVIDFMLKHQAGRFKSVLQKMCKTYSNAQCPELIWGKGAEGMFKDLESELLSSYWRIEYCLDAFEKHESSMNWQFDLEGNLWEL